MIFPPIRYNPPMKILLTTLHARYSHSSLALPCLAAYAAGIEGTTLAVREFTINEPLDHVLRRIAAEHADLVAFSCYIWNIEPVLKLAADFKKISPDSLIILGGPEAGYGCFELLDRNPAIDGIIRGEGEQTFRELVTAVNSNHEKDAGTQSWRNIAGLVYRSGEEIIAAADRPPIARLDDIPSPYPAGLADLTKPLVYYETSRGCPFSCAFCLSSLEKGVRSYSLPRIEADLEFLMASGVKTVKLVDRTFNYDPGRADAIWRHILMNNRSSSFHFEIAADLLTPDNFLVLEKVPAGAFRFEIGIQSGSTETLARVGRHGDPERLSESVKRLLAKTAVTVHLDLVAGLPGEDFPGFLDSLQQVFDLTLPHILDRDPHIQVEPLKVLKGTAMRRIASEEGYQFSDTPPYRILRNPWLDFPEISRIEAIARLLDLLFNSGRFRATLARLAGITPLSRAFDTLAAIWEGHGEPGGAPEPLFELLWSFSMGLTSGSNLERVRDALCYDYLLAGFPAATRLPRFFVDWVPGGGKLDPAGELARGLETGANSRVRSLVRRFGQDPRKPIGQTEETALRFVYISSPGKGLEVKVIDT